MKYVIDRALHTFFSARNPYDFRRYSYNAKYHWYTGIWEKQGMYGTLRVAKQLACGKLYGPFTSLYSARNMSNSDEFCPECLKLYHKARFKGGE